MKGIACTRELVERRVSLNIVDWTGVKNNKDMEKGGELEPKVWRCNITPGGGGRCTNKGGKTSQGSANTLIAPSCIHDHIS